MIKYIVICMVKILMRTHQEDDVPSFEIVLWMVFGSIRGFVLLSHNVQRVSGSVRHIEKYQVVKEVNLVKGVLSQMVILNKRLHFRIPE